MKRQLLLVLAAGMFLGADVNQDDKSGMSESAAISSIRTSGGEDMTDGGLKQRRGYLTKVKVLRLGLRKSLVTDAGLEHLRGIPSLKSLVLIGTRVTESGVRRLYYQDLPGCRIELGRR